MPSRSVRRRQHKRLARLGDLTPGQRRAVAVWWLLRWRKEAQHRARSLEALAAWDLADDPQIRAVVQQLDDCGELQSDLQQVCAEAVAGMAGRHLIAASRPSADRSRRGSHA